MATTKTVTDERTFVLLLQWVGFSWVEDEARHMLSGLLFSRPADSAKLVGTDLAITWDVTFTAPEEDEWTILNHVSHAAIPIELSHYLSVLADLVTIRDFEAMPTPSAAEQRDAIVALSRVILLALLEDDD